MLLWLILIKLIEPSHICYNYALVFFMVISAYLTEAKFISL